MPHQPSTDRQQPTASRRPSPAARRPPPAARALIELLRPERARARARADRGRARTSRREYGRMRVLARVAARGWEASTGACPLLPPCVVVSRAAIAGLEAALALARF
jgi:hypothetical protein